MKIAEPDSIKAGEQELINSIMEHLNSEIIQSIASGKLAVNNLEFRNGDMVIHKNRIVYKMEFQTTVGISVLFDREGNLIDENEESIEEEEIDIEEPDASLDIEASFEDVREDDIDSDDLDFDAIQAETAAAEEVQYEDAEDELENVLAKTREFWLQQTQEAIEPAQTETIASEDEELKAVMQKNKDFWQQQAEAASTEG